MIKTIPYQVERIKGEECIWKFFILDSIIIDVHFVQWGDTIGRYAPLQDNMEELWLVETPRFVH